MQDLLVNATSPSPGSTPPRSLFVFAHPDDETIALGGRLARLANGHLVHVTDGAPRNEQDSHAHGFSRLQDYREARARELADALAAGGVPHLSRECFAVPDQEAALALAEITLWLRELLHNTRFDVVFTHPYEGGHPDHDACAFAVHHAIPSLQHNARKVPAVIEAALYHAGPRGMETGTFLPSNLSQPTPQQEIDYTLSAEERARKQEMLACFTSQQQTLQLFPVTVERFRIAPQYDFTQPAHAGPAFYDAFPWGMTSQRFCRLAREAKQALADSVVRA